MNWGFLRAQRTSDVPLTSEGEKKILDFTPLMLTIE